ADRVGGLGEGRGQEWRQKWAQGNEAGGERRAAFAVRGVTLMSTATTQLLTADDLWRLPDDGLRRELVKGVLYTMPPAGFEHGVVGINLSTPLDQHVKPNRLGLVVGGGTGFLIATNPDTVRAPDIGFVRQARIQATGIPRQYWPGAPDLAVEIVSP